MSSPQWKKNVFQHGLLNRREGWILWCKTLFFREITFLALTFFPRENLLIAKNQCHFPREKNQCHFQKFRQIDGIFWNFSTFYIKIKWFDSVPSMCFFSKLCRNTIARSFLGLHWNCQSLGFIFIPRGFAPWDENLNPRDWQFQCIPRNDRAIL